MAFKTKAPGDQTFEVKGTRKNDGKISGEEILARTFSRDGISYKVETSFNTEGKLTGTLTASEVYKGLELVTGCDTTTRAGDAAQDQSGKVSFKFRHDKFTATGEIQKKRNGQSTISASSTFGYEAFTFGGNVKAVGWAPDSKDYRYSYNVGASYNTKDYSVAVKGMDSMKRLGVGYHHKLNPTLTVGTQYTHSIEEKEPNRNLFALGANYTIDADSSVKGNILSNVGSMWEKKCLAAAIEFLLLLLLLIIHRELSSSLTPPSSARTSPSPFLERSTAPISPRELMLELSSSLTLKIDRVLEQLNIFCDNDDDDNDRTRQKTNISINKPTKQIKKHAKYTHLSVSEMGEKIIINIIIVISIIIIIIIIVVVVVIIVIIVIIIVITN